jgi:lipopolysaccharide export system protein LptA
MTPLRRAALLGVILASTGVPSWSQELSLGGAFATDPAAPVEVTSETLNVDQATGAATFTYDEATSAIARLLATGGVTLATPSEAAEAEVADYDLTARTLTLTGEVLLTQGPSAISADRMIVDLASGTARMEGNVRTILQQAAP